MSQVAQEIHRAMYAPQAEKKAEKVSRCYILPKVGAKWQHLSEKCAPTVEQACDFEKVNVTDMQGDLSDPYNHDLPQEFGEKRGWKWMGGGRGRETFQFKPGCVVKFARSDRVNGRVVGARPWEGFISAAQAEGKHLTGTEQNTYEVATFNSCNESVKELMVPIIAHSPKPQYKWLVLPTARVKGDGLTPRIDWYEVVDYLERELPNRNATVVDLHEGNVGKLEGNPVLVDYGFRTTCPPSKKTDKTIAKKLSEFIPAPKAVSGKKCVRNYECDYDEACVDNKCKKHPTKGDVDDEVHRVVLLAEIGLNKSDEDEVRNYMRRARVMQNDGYYIRAIDLLNDAKIFIQEQASKAKGRGLTSADVLNAMTKAVKDFDLRDYPSTAGRNFDELLNKAEHAKNKGLYAQAMRYVNLARDQMKSKKKTEQVALFSKAKGFKVAPQDAKKAKIVLDMAKIVSAQGRSMDAAFMREQARKIKEFGAQAVRAHDSELMMKILDTKHKQQIAEIGARGRHGLKRPRKGDIGELTRKRRVLWARAGELRRNANKLPVTQSQNKRAMIDEARFLEQQAWHFQTKQMRSGKAPLSDPFKMMRILKPEQRSYFPDLKLQMDREYDSPPSYYSYAYETPPEEA